jgi:XisI protein
MASLEKYRACIQHLLTERARKGGDQWVEAQTIFDTAHDHYQLLYNGWHNTKRIFGPALHLDIKEGKIWIQWNGTEDDIAAELVALGVPKDDIVLGFHTPRMRQYTEYAVS